METGSALVAALLGSAQDATWVVSRDLAITHFNDAFSRLAIRSLGVTPHPGISLNTLVDASRHPAIHGHWLDLFRRALRQIQTTSVSIRNAIVDSNLHRTAG